MSPAALALDLGTTRIKAAALSPSGALHVQGCDAPEPSGPGDVRESDAEAYLSAAERLLAGLASDASPRTPLGIATQRSSFLVWRARDGAPVTPLVSWQDRSAAPWCAAHAHLEERVRALTGLPLSPHYAAPKLAQRLRSDPGLARGLAQGALLWGTLECALAWRLGSGRVHALDVSMAARTLLFDTLAGAWSHELLELFGIPPRGLPEVVASCGRHEPLDNGLVLAATLADQPAALAYAPGMDPEAALVNVGTGAFVLRPTGTRRVLAGGYLCGPVLAREGRTLFALEGTVNGGGATAERLAPGPTELPAADPDPQAFCLPDENGVGAPYWRPRQGLAYSPAARDLDPGVQRRVVLEGLVFRLADIVEDLARAEPLQRVVLSGGLARDPFLPRALAEVLETRVELLEQTESTLLGVAHLAAGSAARAEQGRAVPREGTGAWLRSKRVRWRAWLAELLAAG